MSNIETKKGLAKYRKFSKRKIKKIILWSVGIFFGLIVLLFAWYAKDLPTPGKIKDRAPIESTKIMDRNGNILYDVHGEQKRTVVKSNEIPDIVKQATVAAEDKNFYKHFGLDFTGIARALYRDIFHRGDVLQGGSTITQQYVKNALLTTKQTFDRKIKELILSLELEAMYSKDEILTMYLNEIPYGSNAYGIEAASQTYYKKSVKDLTLDEATTLASLPNAPTYYSPYGIHPDKLKIRRDYILDRMVDLKYITAEKATEAKDKKIEVVEQEENITAPHFVLYVKEKLVEMYGEEKVTEGGLKVTTTLDLNNQKIAEEAVKTGYEKNKSMGAGNAALVSIDPTNGQILAMVGSHDFFDTENDGQVNVTVSDRQPGSSFKPIVYATGFKDKYNPASTLWDVKTDFGNYTPANYNGNFNGPVSIRFALANSLNIPAVKMLALVGIDNALKTAHEMGITTLNEPSQYGLSLVLGGGEVKPIDMATAFSVFANKGVKNDTTPFLKIEDNQGKVLYEYQAGKNQKQVLDPQIAYEISSILSDNNARSSIFGSRSALYFADRTVAAKTGTTDGFHDAWTVGYTPQLTAAVWVGNNDNSPMYTGADGSVVAAPIFHEYMARALSDKPDTAFDRPSEIKDFTVDKLSGKIPTDQSPEKITDIFASWQIPKEYDDIHVKVKVCKVCSDLKLADENCPSGQIEERTYTNLHSEQPNNANWENAVRYAAEAMGMSLGTPPKEVCDVNSVKPSISISAPASGASLSGNFDIQTNPNSGFGVSAVEFYIDNIKIGTSNSGPFNMTYNANNLSSGSHELMVKVIDSRDLTATNKITINTTKDSTPPGAISGVGLTPGSKYINIGWTNPSDSDLNSVRIYVSTAAGSLGSKNAEVAASSGTAGSTGITGLSSGTTYYFTLRAVDKSGNENNNTTQFSAKAL